MAVIASFTPSFSPPAWADLRARLRQTRWPAILPGTDVGLTPELLRELCLYWEQEFDWQAQIDRLSMLPNYRFGSSAGQIHFIHVKGKGASSLPLILTHGWPGSFVEMLEIIPLLTDPTAHGILTDISFDVVVPSLPGFGFSDRPERTGVNAFRTAEIWVELMRSLGYERFGAQGGDIGAGISTALGLLHPEHILGIHLNYIPGSYRPHVAADATISEVERQFLEDASRWYDRNGAYAHLQGTRPQTAANALNDSPAGLAAWIVEKFLEWSDSDGNVYNSFSRDALLTNVTLYWMTETIRSSFQMYWEGRRTPFHFSPTEYVQPPCAIACFPKEILIPPRSWVERGYNVTRWTVMPRGGHFAAAEEPKLLASDLLAFFSSLRA